MIEFLSSAPTLDGKGLTAAKGVQQDPEAVRQEAHRQVENSPVLDNALKETLHEGIDEVLSSRIADVQVAFLTGFPELAALCVEGHPIRHVAIEACASTAVIVSAASIAARYRWDLVVKQTENGRIHQLSAGPGFGAHVFWATSWMGGNADSAPESGSIDLQGSLEYVYWISKHFGLTTQLDVGASAVINPAMEPVVRILPTGKLTFGIAF
jgi:hypothetical protein